MRHALFPVFAAVSCLATSGPLRAQDTADVAALRAEIARLKAALTGLEGRLGAIEARAAGSAPTAEAAPVALASPAPAPASVAVAAPTPAPAPAPAASAASGPAIKLRGRLQIDSGYLSRPAGIVAPGAGWSADVRRAYLGVDGTLGAGFGYRVELDFAGGDTQFTDAWLTYRTGPVTVTLGNHKTFATLDDMTSDLDTSLLERPAFLQAFGMERRVGLSAGYVGGPFVFNAGIFADDPDTLAASAQANGFSLDTRLVFMPKIGATQLHLGGSLHHRELNDVTPTLRYRARPGLRTTDMRFVDTGMFSASAETGYGAEFAAIHGRLHVAAEAFWQRAVRPGAADPLFFGGYGEIGYVLAGSKGRSYRNGTFGSIRPTRGLDKGGGGAWQINLRHDWLDLNSAGVSGGRQRTLGASLVWVPIDRLKFLANYLHVEVEDTPVMAGTRSDYGADVAGLRAQYDF